MSSHLREIRRRSILLPIILTIPVVTFGYNIVDYPAFETDEGFYIHNAMAFAKEGIIVEEYPYSYPYKYVHPPLGWMAIGAFFWIVDFPTFFEQIGPSPQGAWWLFFVPRVFISALALIDVLLVYLIASRVYRSESHGILAAAIFAVAEPSVRYFRIVLLDPVMTTFLLASTAALLMKRRFSIQLSGFLLGAAILTKLPALFFTPALSLQLYRINAQEGQQRCEKIRILLIWFGCILAVVALWPAYAFSQGELSSLIEAQIWHVAGRGATFGHFDFFMVMVYAIWIHRHYMLGFVLGLIALPYLVIKRDLFVPSMCASFLGLFAILNLSFAFHYLIPLLPLLAISGARFLRDGLGYITRVIRRFEGMEKMPLYEVALLGIILAASFQTAIDISKDESKPQVKAVDFLLENAPENSTVIASPAVSWILEGSEGFEVHHLGDIPDDIFQRKDYYVIFDSETIWLMRLIFEDSLLGKKMQELYDSTFLVARFESDERITEVRVSSHKDHHKLGRNPPTMALAR